jgi:uncharacterized membrane protein
MLRADMSLALDPAWPFSLPSLGLPALIGAAILLAALTIWTYLGVKKAAWRRVAIVLGFRLLALLVALSMLMRPSFAVIHLQGVDVTKLLVVGDASESMNFIDDDAKPSRWDQVKTLWTSRNVQRRLEHLRSEEKIEVVKYLGDGALRLDDPTAFADGKRTDLGAWLHELWQKHSHEKNLRGIVIFSDGADNGTKFSAQEKARQWRGVAPIHTFGVGNPDAAKLRKDIAPTSLRVADSLVPVKTKFSARAVAQAPGFKDAEVEVIVSMEDVKTKKSLKVGEIARLKLKQEKDQPIVVECTAPDDSGEYKLTLRITPHPDESNKENNEISTYLQVVKEEIKVLWVDRYRFYEPRLAIDLALKPEKRFRVREVRLGGAEKGDPLAYYGLDTEHFDVIVIGDVSAKQFSFGDDTIFDKIKKMVEEKKTGLLMLGGSETFVKGGWQKHKPMMDLLPVEFDVMPEKVEFSTDRVRAIRTQAELKHPLLVLDSDPKINKAIWEEHFEDLEGLAPVGCLAKGATELLRGTNDKLIMAATLYGIGRVVVFASDSTAASWLTPQSAAGYKRFWKQLVFWLSQQEDLSNQLWIKLDNRRLNANAEEILDFTFGLKDKTGDEIRNATFEAKVIGPDGKQELPVILQGQRGTFQAAKVPGEHQLAITAKADGKVVEAHARFLVAFDDIEMLRPLAEHETLRRIAADADGRFHVLEEQALLQYLDELKNQVNRESRHKTTHWPDWKRVPVTEHPRDQLSGLWNSFTLVSFLLFVALLVGEWSLRRLWGLV